MIDEEPIVVEIIDNDSINTSIPDSSYIPGYVEAENQRVVNENQRITNETARESYINQLKQDVIDGKFNGKDGIIGHDGEDGISPIITSSKQGKITTLTIIDAEGTKTAELRDGEDGSGTGDMLKSTYDTNNSGVVDNAEKVNNHSVNSDVPSDAVFTDTTYTAGTGIAINNGVISNTQTSAEWGNISGTLNNQADLKKALDSKANSDAIPDELCDLSDDSTHRLVTDVEKTEWNNKSNFSGDYNDLLNKPTIPDKLCDLSDDSTHRLVTDVEKIEWNKKSNFSGDYNDLLNKPTIPSKTSDLTNDSRFITATGDVISEINSNIGDLSNLETEAKNNLVSAINEANQHGAGETLPVGSELDFDGNVSDIPDGWEQIIDTKKLLWTNPNPTNNIQNVTNITLSDDDTNYDVLGVFYKIAADGISMSYMQIVRGGDFDIGTTGYGGAGLRRIINRNSSTSYTIKAYNGETLADSSTGKYIIPLYIVGYKTGLFN